ncbi:folate family ECF transporter S component [Floccifex sp.]|uniref:folate family ECF transporter S component n=1 Tax=Floccifex sp. TaxID=2815810 RepID=UPI002A760BC0|nr:folate family ECF transporter S component [Floccifex sp.]MDD7281251.1 folate family ECF transporter S component [Erysipelotrichaceae bacterium]MDY2958736.1 folate family ECF transporter S component [Floccifex sp.]
MLKSVQTIKDSCKELKQVSSLTGTALLTALKAILAQFTIPVSNIFEIGFTQVVVGVCGLYYGPVLSGLAGILMDNIEYLLRPSGPYFPGFALNEFMTGFLYGLFFYKQENISWKRVLCAQLSVTCVNNLFLTPLWLSILYGKAFHVLWMSRLTIQFIRFPIDFALLYIVIRTVTKIRKPRV